MNALLFSILAAGCGALAGLFFRKNNDDAQGDKDPVGYLTLFYLSSFILSLFLSSEIWNTKINFTVLAIGGCVGLLSSVLMLLTFRALKQGPAGLTFAFQNASAVFPGLILFILLGSDFGFSCSSIQLLGMVLVLFGLFLGATKETSHQPQASSKWIKYALACFIVQILALTLIQARCILFDIGERVEWLSSLSFTEVDDVWFMPGQFGAGFIVQAIIFVRRNKRFQKRELAYGFLGGLANFLSTYLLLLATKLALPSEKGILFPCFAVACMMLCNLWANRLYNEHFNLKTNVLCSFGIFMAVAS